MVSRAATMRWLLVITPSFKGTLKSTLKIIRDQNKVVPKLSHNITVIAETPCIIYKIFLLTSSKFVYRQDLGCQLPVCSMPWLNYHNDSQPQIKTIHNSLQNESPSASEGHSSCSLDTEQADRAGRCGRILSTVKVKVTLRRLLLTFSHYVCLDLIPKSHKKLWTYKTGALLSTLLHITVYVFTQFAECSSTDCK
jgi:hypothetical protein